MKCRKMLGLYRKNGKGHWIIDKRIYGQRIYESTKTTNLVEAQKHLVRRLEEIRQAVIFGVSPKRTFDEAANKLLAVKQHMKCYKDYELLLKIITKYIGNEYIDSIHMGSLQTFINTRRQEGVKAQTINQSLKLIRHILNLAASEWIDETGLIWLHTAPKIKLLPELDIHEPYPLTWDEQDRLFKYLPEHLRLMALFAVNTGTRDSITCGLRWDWEIVIPELNTSVFFVPKEYMKNNRNHVVILNETAREVVDQCRGGHPLYVFAYRGNRVQRMSNNGWRKARVDAGLEHVRVHDLRHTFGRRLRAAGVSLEDREDILGHKSIRMTTHYSAAELGNLITAANKVCRSQGNTPNLVTLHRGSAAECRTQIRTQKKQNPADLPQVGIGRFLRFA